MLHVLSKEGVQISQISRSNYRNENLRRDLIRAEEILRVNGQFHDTIADGVFPYAGSELECYDTERSIGYVAKENDMVVGFIRGSCDGNRGLIQQLSVHPDFQNRGIGKNLVRTFADKLNLSYGLRSVGVISAANKDLNSVDYYKKLGFVEIPAKILVHPDIAGLVGTI
jgi:ribosomal protein S18 acetylase RimI-like enzyme